MPEAVLQAMHRASPNIYGTELVELANSLYPDLQKVACTSGDAVIYIGNGHSAWEASLTNTLSRGDTVLAIVTGRFTLGWIDIAEAIGINVEAMDFGSDSTVDGDRLRQTLDDDKSHRYKAVLMVQTDTASSVNNDVLAVRSALDAVDHPALLMVDCIASLGCEEYRMDDWGVDVTVAACQKGLMTPAGLSFTFIGDKAWQAHAKADLKTAYWDWDRRVNGKIFYQKFCGTPPTHHLFGLRTALDILFEEGLDNVWQRHRNLARVVWACVDQWATDGDVRCNIKNIDNRSVAVTTVQTGTMDADRLRQWCEQQYGVILGVGLALEDVYADMPANLFRIGHMGHLNVPMLMGTLVAIDAGFKALDYPHGSGALEHASRTIANLSAA